MKLLGISLGTLIMAGLIWSTLWFWGQGLTYQPYNHPLVSWTTNGEAWPALAASSPTQAQNFLEKNPDAILMINLHVSNDGKFFSASPEAFDFIKTLPEKNPENYKGNKHFYYTFDFLKTNSGKDLFSLEQWMTLKPRFWIFNIMDNALDIDRHLTEWIERNKMQDQVVITSDIDLVTGSLKDKNPLWVYGSSLSDLTKMLTMASINLESLVNFKRDFYITPVAHKGRDVLNAQVMKEMRRRYKKIAIGPVHTDQDRARALEFKPDILIQAPSLTDNLQEK